MLHRESAQCQCLGCEEGFVDDKHIMFLFIAMEASGFSRVACRTEEMLDPCVSASLSVLDTDHRGAPHSLLPLCCQCQSVWFV